MNIYNYDKRYKLTHVHLKYPIYVIIKISPKVRLATFILEELESTYEIRLFGL